MNCQLAPSTFCCLKRRLRRLGPYDISPSKARHQTMRQSHPVLAMSRRTRSTSCKVETSFKHGRGQSWPRNAMSCTEWPGSSQRRRESIRSSRQTRSAGNEDPGVKKSGAREEATNGNGVCCTVVDTIKTSCRGGRRPGATGQHQSRQGISDGCSVRTGCGTKLDQGHPVTKALHRAVETGDITRPRALALLVRLAAAAGTSKTGTRV